MYGDGWNASYGRSVPLFRPEEHIGKQSIKSIPMTGVEYTEKCTFLEKPVLVDDDDSGAWAILIN